MITAITEDIHSNHDDSLESGEISPAGSAWFQFPLHGINARTHCYCDKCKTAAIDDRPVPHAGGCTCANKVCGQAGKHPRTLHGFRDASNDPEMLGGWQSQWADCNWGILTGPQNGIWVVDLDGSEGIAKLATLEAEYGKLPETYAVKTGGGGMHLYWLWDDSRPVGCGQNLGGDAENATKIDVRGDGGYIIAAGSLHATGNVYEIRNEDAEIVSAPQWLLDWVLANGGGPKPEHDATACVEADWHGQNLSEIQSRAAAYVTRIDPVGTGEDGGKTAFRVACALAWGFGLDPADALPVFADWNAQCERPRTEEKLHHKLTDALDPTRVHDHPRGHLLAGMAGEARSRTYHHTDTGNAMRLVDLCGEDIRYVDGRQHWSQWDGKRWATAPAGALLRQTKSVAAAWHDDAKAAYDNVRQADQELQAADDDNRERLTRDLKAAKKTADDIFKHANNSEAATKRDAMVRLAIAEPGVTIDPAEMDKDRYLFNCSNGTIDLRTGEIKPHDREDLITQLAKVEYNPEATCPEYDKFMDIILGGNQEEIDSLHRFIGSLLSGDVSEQVVLFLIGEGNNGKSTLRKLISDMLDDYAIGANAGLLIGKPAESDATAPTKMSLAGKRAVMVSETVEGARLSEDNLKDLTGGEPVRGHGKYEAPWSYDPTHKIIFSSNHAPVIYGTDIGTRRRIARFEFRANFKTVTDPDFDPAVHVAGIPDFVNKLLSERSGILNRWLLGYKDWVAHGRKMAPPESIRINTEEYLAENDIIGQYVEERLIRESNGAMDNMASIKASVLYQDYREWCDHNGRRAKTSNAFSRALTGHKIEKTRKPGGMYYTRVRIRDSRG